MRALISPQNAALKRISLVLFGLICMLWVSIYGVIVTGAFSRVFWASITAIDTVSK